MKNILIFLILNILILNIFSCKKSKSLIYSSDEELEYVPGQVAIGLVDTVSYNFITNFLDALNLEILDLDLGHNFWAIADSNDFEYYQDIFSTDSTVESMGKLFTYSTKDTLSITITFNGINSPEADSLKLESVGLSVFDVKIHLKSALLGCAFGKEKYWIDRLITYDFIRWAEYNYIIHSN